MDLYVNFTKIFNYFQSYKRRRLLEVHIRSVHTGERPYKCKICHAAFAYPEHCKKHMRTHSGIKPYACEICSRTFASKDNRNVHRYIHGKRKPYECQVFDSGSFITHKNIS